MAFSSCEVCGMKDYTLEDGYYYCNECGTKLRNQREVLDVFNSSCNDAVVNDEKVVENKISSWEQMNYFLHGLTERMVELGAPPELKTTALQIWCSYLRLTEVAFFNKRQRQRPRLSLLNQKWDMKFIYNRILQDKNKSKRKMKNFDTSTIRGRKKLNKEVLEEQFDVLTQSQSSDLESTLDTLSSSMQESSNIPQKLIGFRFNTRTRKNLSKVLSEEHIKWHEEEAPINASCHSITFAPAEQNLRKLDDCNYANIHRKTILMCIINLAVNQTRSQVQMSDIWRWRIEGHLPFHNLKQYLPEELHPTCYTETLIQLSCTNVGLDESRFISSSLAKDLGIVPIPPDMNALCVRFLGELALPLDLATYITKLIAIAPPISQNERKHYLPNYEVHALKYILFIMKLLFGLDGVNETKLDSSTEMFNERISQSSTLPKLFVWHEWQRYVNMRRVILEQVHYPTNHWRAQAVINRPLDNELFLDYHESLIVPDEDNATGYQSFVTGNRHGPFQERQFKNLHTIIATKGIHELQKQNKRSKKHISFDHSLQPQRSYMAEVLKMEEDGLIDLYIPEYMRTDHCERVVAPFVNPLPLKRLMLKHEKILLNTKTIKPSLKHIKMSHFKAQRSDIDAYLKHNKHTNVLLADEDNLNDIDAGNEANILEYINAAGEAKRSNPQDLLHKVLCRNVLEDIEHNLCAAIASEDDLDTNETNPYVNNPKTNEILPDEDICSESAQIALPSYHYWVNSGYIQEISSETFEQEYSSKFPPSFRFLLREAAYIAQCSTYDLYYELNELEKYFFKAYRRIK